MQGGRRTSSYLWQGSKCPLPRAVASLTVPGGREFHFPHLFLKFQRISLIFPQSFSFSSSFWPSGWVTRPPGKALATPLPLPLCHQMAPNPSPLQFQFQFNLFVFISSHYYNRFTIGISEKNAKTEMRMPPKTLGVRLLIVWLGCLRKFPHVFIDAW